MTTAAAIFLFGFAPLTIAAMFSFDRIVRREHGHHRQQWEADGGPDGFFWTASEGGPDAGFWSRWKRSIQSRRQGVSARMKLWLPYVFRRPSWAAGDPEARQRFLIYRVAVLSAWTVWGIGLVAFIRRW